MTETVRVLTRPERLLSFAVAALLAAGSVSAAAVEPEARTAPVARTQAAPTPAPPAPKPPPPAAKKPAPAVKKPAAKPAPVALPPAPPEVPQAGCPVPRKPGKRRFTPKRLKPPAVAEDALPAPVARRPKARDLSAVAGKGVWVTNFAQDRVDAASVVAKAKAAGARSVWVRTGGKQGYYGSQFLPQLVPAAHAAGLAVVAWDFPYLSDPVADAKRAQQAFADGIDAFAPDVETQYEGTYATARRVELYMSLVRSYAGHRPVAATVPRPTPQRRATFPYKAFVPYADLFVPMVYWSCHEPGRLVLESLTELGKMLPVAPAGQGYNMGDEGGRRGWPTRAETWRFLDVAHRGGAIGASIWTIERVGPGQLDALRDYPWTHRAR